MAAFDFLYVLVGNSNNKRVFITFRKWVNLAEFGKCQGPFRGHVLAGEAAHRVLSVISSCNRQESKWL